MSDQELYDTFDELAGRLPDPPVSSVAAVQARARRRRRQRVWAATAAVLLALVAGAALAAGLGEVGEPEPVTPRIGQPFGPVLAEASPCFGPRPGCPERSGEQAVAETRATLEGHPEVEVRKVGHGRELAPSPPPHREGEDRWRTARVVFRLERTTTDAATELLRELVSDPTIHLVMLGTAEQPPSAATGPGMERERTFGQLQVPVHGSDEVLEFETWQGPGGQLCHTRAAGQVCAPFVIKHGRVGGGSGPFGEEAGACRTVKTGLGVADVRMTWPDGTRLPVASTPMHPDLPLVDLHAACWVDGPRAGRASVELIGPDGQSKAAPAVGSPASSPSR